jgi:hypothetical protein
MVRSQGVGVQQPHLCPQDMLDGPLPYGPPPQVGPPYTPPLVPLLIHHDQQQALAPPTPMTWSLWMGSWGQQSLANSFSTMSMVLPTVTDCVVDSDTSNHTTLDVSNLIYIICSHINDPSSIIVGNRSSLPVTSVGDKTLLDSFYLNNVLVTLDIIQNLLSVRLFTTDN